MQFRCGLCAIALALFLPFPGRAADEKPKSEPVNFLTVDQVELNGNFYPSTKDGKKSPTVLLLHTLRDGKSNEEGWNSLAEEFQKKGYAVLSFDFRGHNSSTTIKRPEEFWKFKNNQAGLKSFKPSMKDLPAQITHQDFRAGYETWLVNDIMAAKLFLEKKNDAGECNVSNLIVVGAGEGATLGALWIAAETKRFAAQNANPFKSPVGPYKVETISERKDVSCAIWLSISPTLGKPPGQRVPVTDWLLTGGGNKEGKVPMVFIYGAENEKDDKFAGVCVRHVRPGYKREGTQPTDNLPATGDRGIAKTDLSGSKLLTRAETVTWIFEYLEKRVLDKFARNNWEERRTKGSSFVWQFGTTRPIPAKQEGEDYIQPIPLDRFLR